MSDPQKAARLVQSFAEEPRVYGVSYTLHEDAHRKIGLNIVRPGGVHPPGQHGNGVEFFFVLAGEGTAVLDGDRFPMTPETVVTIPRNTVHSVENTGPTPLRYLYVISFE